ncbi:DUF4286 family protein [Chloroflexota bacterium]
MEPSSVVNVVGLRCPSDEEADVVKWLTECDIPTLMKFKKLRGCTLLKILNPDEKYPTLLLIWEFNSQEDYEDYEKSPERAEAMKAAPQAWSKYQVELLWRAQFKAIKAWEQ